MRLHTFLFADLVGFTSFTARHGDERAADVAVSFQRDVEALAAAHGCDVVKSVGDGIMVRGEDGAEAVALARRIVALAAQSRLPPVRVGLDTGPAVRRGADWRHTSAGAMACAGYRTSCCSASRPLSPARSTR